MKALLASGVKVEGLEAGSNEAGPSKPKKVVYGRRKPAKKGGAETPESVKEPEPAPVQAPAPEEAKPASPAPAAAAAEDDWDKSDEEKVDDLVQGVKDVAIEDSGDDWDKSSGDEAAPPTKQDAVKSAHPPKAPGMILLADNIPVHGMPTLIIMTFQPPMVPLQQRRSLRPRPS
jgi:translation initiation factor 5B